MVFGLDWSHNMVILARQSFVAAAVWLPASRLRSRYLMRAGCLVATLSASALIAGGTMAQSARPEAVQVTGWTLDTPKPKAAHKGRPVRPEPAIPPEFVTRAARNKALQQEYFAKQAAPVERETVPQFGGYDAATMTGDGRPGMGFKF